MTYIVSGGALNSTHFPAALTPRGVEIDSGWLNNGAKKNYRKISGWNEFVNVYESI